ncbi:PIN domain-containing protein [Actinomycetospora sp. TBRC 11914]|uniref:PIN domain-containing protein n=1 Tax=Actinomycetospora sp. TBRC 11914 TaxID=2729387 RepID=UPI00145DCE5B|nr:type II toxin-antitoxin system VapC family toxin [Actinomycetospora sp. TBRC 11914]NMO89721.1 type II toxin-antitoxin system VapC family toxin [Actinomycetospora sp. TBRC 11914]
MTGPEVVVLDASALLAWLFEERGADVVESLLPAAVLSTVNLAEVRQKLDHRGVDADRTVRRLRLLGLRTAPFSDDDAARAAGLWQAGRRIGLSLADRCCLAVAGRLGVPAVTADRSWGGIDLPVEVRVLR